MTEPESVIAGIVGRPHGVRGEVVFHAGNDDLTRFAPGRVFDTERGSLTISASRRHHGRFILAFEEVGDRDAAEALRGLAIRVPPADIPLTEDEWWPTQLIGCRVVLEDGTQVGEVLGVTSGLVQDRLIVGTPDPVEIPFVRELVPGVDIENRTVTIAPPEGLVGSSS